MRRHCELLRRLVVDSINVPVLTFVYLTLLFDLSIAVVNGLADLFACLLAGCAAPRGYPRIVESPTLKAVEKDRNTVMVCSATGNPEPSILWLKDYIPVDLSDPRIKLLHTGQCVRRDWLPPPPRCVR